MTRQPPPADGTGAGARTDRETTASETTASETTGTETTGQQWIERRRRWLVLVVVGCLAVTAVAGGVAVGSTDAAGAEPKQVDIVFVVDSSESMNTVRSELARDIGVLRQQLEGEGIDARYGLVTYSETATVKQELTGNYDEFDAAMEFGTGGNYENASNALLVATEMDYRPNAERVIVLVTDEDDDSPTSVRQQAFEELSSANFVAVSQSVDRPDPPASWCPCDDSAANEPPTMAEAVGGDWLDVRQSRAAILEEIGEIVTAEILDLPNAKTPEDGSGGGSDGGDGDAGTPDVRVQSITTNESTVEAGERIAVTVTLANDGPVPGDFEAYVHRKESPDDFGFEVVGTRSVEVPADGTREVTFTTTFPDVRDYYVYTAGADTTVSVVEQESTTVQTTANESRVTASVSDPEPGEVVEVELESVSLGTVGSASAATGDADDATADSGPSEQLGTLDGLRVTPASERDFTVTVTRLAVTENRTVVGGTATDTVPANGTAAFPDDVEPLSVLSVDSSLSAEEVENVTLEYTVGSPTTRLYRYDEASDSWTPVAADAAVANESKVGEGRQVVTRTDGDTLFAVVETQPVISVVDASVRQERLAPGETLQTTVTVENTGLQAGGYTTALTVDGETVATARMVVPANATETFVFNYRPQTAGEYTVSVNGTVAGTVTVDAAEDDTGESSGTASEQTGTATGTQTPTATAAVTDTATPTASTPTTESTEGEAGTTEQTATEQTTTAPAATDSLAGESTTGSAPGFTSASLALAILVLSILSLWRRL